MLLIMALLSVACARAADAFHPWALNDSKAFVFPRIAEKRNRVRRGRLAAALRRKLKTCGGAARVARARFRPKLFSRRGGWRWARTFLDN